jgi:hypothetical protein
MGLLTKTRTRPWAGFLAGTHGLGRALARPRAVYATKAPPMLRKVKSAIS